ncbi:hypothetical protein BBI17_009530 [Phytophthora kernoviae]|uniref:Uncharacterized protein n=2 Tax=Phytophthora kernoviae TaxID=325452 RepID=A0A3R7G0J2_9STRA|nr:hypothetical protein G195_011153 [Phytophthora kernoviae 00238/432]RLN11162.1 hypothetical protein BBI17_009530 [Phytophthora kernoviae]
MSFGSRHVLQGIDKAINDQIQAIIAYEEEVNPLQQLVQTGYIVQQIVRLDRLLDATLAAYGISEPRGRAQWHSQQLQVFTLLVYDFQKHAEDTYTELERGVMLNVYEICTRLSGLTVVTTPEWFVPVYEPGGICITLMS